ncbi:MAG: (2Fe-2S)-binding protein [Spirochaetales bacterium]|nr:(2Fe-2S)-binding protein [Spirochaetales bacterium]
MESMSLIVNGNTVSVDFDIRETLLDVIRDRLGLTGTKRGCDEGACGACTVLFNGLPVNSCSILAIEASGTTILTIEGLAKSELHPLQQSFIDCGAVQCGFCTPGMILSSLVLLKANPAPSRDEIREALSGNLCRCTGYRKIIDAVEHAAGRIGSNRG